jgi:hypothetical protein
MAEHVIEIVIGTDGKIKGEVKGVKGQQCGPLSKWLDELGAVEKDSKTADWHKNADQNLTVRR